MNVKRGARPSSDLASPSRSALAPGASRIVRRFDDERVASTIRAALDRDELRTKAAVLTLAQLATESARSRRLIPGGATLGAGELRAAGLEHYLASAAKHRRLDLEPLPLQCPLLRLTRSKLGLQHDRRRVLTAVRLLARSIPTELAAVATFDRLLQPADLLLAVNTPHALLSLAPAYAADPRF